MLDEDLGRVRRVGGGTNHSSGIEVVKDAEKLNRGAKRRLRRLKLRSKKGEGGGRQV